MLPIQLHRELIPSTIIITKLILISYDDFKIEL